MSSDAFIRFSLDTSALDRLRGEVESALRPLGHTTFTWNEEGVEEIKQTGGEFVDEKALEVAASAMPPVDTGFLQASAYVHSSRQSTFDATWPSDYYTSTKTGHLRARERAEAPEQPSDQYGAVAGWAAVYAWFIEEEQPFIYPALMGMAGAEDRGPLNLGGRRFVSPRGGRPASTQSSSSPPRYPSFVDPNGPAEPSSDTIGIDRSNPNFVSPSGTTSEPPRGDRGIDRSNRNFVEP